MARTTPENCPFPWGSASPSNAWFLGPTHRAHTSIHSKQHLDRFSLFCTGYRKVSHYFTMGRYEFPPNCPFPLRDRVPHLTVGTYRAHPSYHPERHLDRFCRFCMGPKCYAITCIVNGKKPKIAPSPWDFVTPLEDFRATAIGNMHIKLGKDRACGSGDILADRQTHRHTQTYSSQYFATAPAGEVITA